MCYWILFDEISPGCSLEGLILKLKLQYFGHLMQRADSFAKTLMLGKIEGRRRRGWQRMRWLDGITDTMNMGLGGLQDLVMNREAWHAVVHGVAKSRTWLSNWNELNWTEFFYFPFSHSLTWLKEKLRMRDTWDNRVSGLFYCTLHTQQSENKNIKVTTRWLMINISFACVFS